MIVIYCMFHKSGMGLPVNAPAERVKAEFPRLDAALADLSRLLPLKKGFSWSARTDKGRLIIDLSGAPARSEWMERWASWVALEALGQADPVMKRAKLFGGITGVDALALPLGELHSVEYPKVADTSNLGIPHDGLRAGVRRLLERGGDLPMQAVAGLRSPVRGIPETLLLSQFSQALFLDPWTAGIERLPGRLPAVRVTTRPMALSPFLLPAYGLAVRCLFRCSLV